ncbi:helix-hairpin-helix domain-containing protein [Nitrosomonas ureae]|uniref:Helix-hairpin-helix domain-containing protein n=1 Tax=Nitrosomonas ureae TaxID=44577 RepID=A0A1H9BIT3_9PROT|nr:helix-hairpin-helix domain-containing protein [Nitrosomonas ureae]SEP88533.1 Helix-hairpin-helix domain-containing protein [Nitrosomonas ureae]
MLKLTDVTGIGPITVKILSEHKIRTVEALAAISLAELQKIPGFSGAIRARAVKKSAADCLQAKPVKPLTTAGGDTQAKAKKTPGKITVANQIVSQPEPSQTDDESKKKKRSDDKRKVKDKKKKDKDKKKEGKKKGKNKKKS